MWGNTWHRAFKALQTAASNLSACRTEAGAPRAHTNRPGAVPAAPAPQEHHDAAQATAGAVQPQAGRYCTAFKALSHLRNKRKGQNH